MAKLERIGVSFYSNKYNLSITNVIFMKNRRFSTQIGSYPPLSYWLGLAQLVSSPLCSSSPLVSSPHILDPFHPYSTTRFICLGSNRLVSLVFSFLTYIQSVLKPTDLIFSSPHSGEGWSRAEQSRAERSGAEQRGA